jgi:lipoprotein-releasing system permease protein
MSFRWIWFIASRYLFHRQKKSPSPVFSILGIATGVFALIVIIAVMNGFQLSFIESIIEISSYHLRVGLLPDDAMEEARAALLNIPETEAVVPFQEFQAIVRGRRGGQHAAMVRGLPANAYMLDGGMAKRLEFEDGHFNQADPENVLIGAELARRLGVSIGGEVNLYSISSIFADDDSGAAARTFIVTGIFRTGYYEYDTA